MAVKVNLTGIGELDFPTGVSSATLSSPGVATITLTASASLTHAEPLTDGNSNFIFAGGDIVIVVGVTN